MPADDHLLVSSYKAAQYVFSRNLFQMRILRRIARHVFSPRRGLKSGFTGFKEVSLKDIEIKRERAAT